MRLTVFSKSILSIAFLLSFFDLLGQTNYARFVNDNKKGEKQKIDTSDGGSEEIIYLGVIRDKNGQIIYHVLSVVRLVQSAIVKHGNTEVVFLDKSLKLFKTYSLGLPDELPFLLKENTLNFYYTDEKTNTRKVFQNVISRQLPEFFCVAPNDCYF